MTATPKTLSYFSTFTGIGGFEYGIHKVLPTAACVGYSEVNEYAIKVYERHYDHTNYGDITAISTTDLPNFDLIVGGFPCQAFSVAGYRKGFDDTRGTLFFDIARILADKRPRHLVLENVKGLLSHDSGKTFSTILGVLSDIGYDVEWQVLNSKNFGVAQNRERIYIVGHLGEGHRQKVFPLGSDQSETVNKTSGKGRIVRLTRREKIGYYDAGDGRACTIDANYYKGIANQERPGVLEPDGRLRRLTPIECERLQGFPDNWTKEGILNNCNGKLCKSGEHNACLGHFVEISDTQRYKMCGNAVTTNVVEAVMRKLTQSCEL